MRWWVLALAASRCPAAYYEDDVIGRSPTFCIVNAASISLSLGMLNGVITFKRRARADERTGSSPLWPARVAFWHPPCVLGAALTAIGRNPTNELWPGAAYSAQRGAISSPLGWIGQWFPPSGISLATAL